MSHPFFFVGFALLLVHEMDAVRLGEWKIFPLLRSLRDEAGYAAFAALHVPIYALLLAGLFGGGGASSALIVGMDAFFVVHLALHVLFRNHPENRFGSAFSWSLIAGSGACGLVDLVLLTGI
jgi:hypothetical protein